MKQIAELVDNIDEEMEDAKKYCKLAMSYKTEKPNLSKLYTSIANEENSHIERLHNAVTECIEEYRRTVGEPPEYMRAVYNYEHKKYIERVKEIRLMLSMI